MVAKAFILHYLVVDLALGNRQEDRVLILKDSRQEDRVLILKGSRQEDRVLILKDSRQENRVFILKDSRQGDRVLILKDSRKDFTRPQVRVTMASLVNSILKDSRLGHRTLTPLGLGMLGRILTRPDSLLDLQFPHPEGRKYPPHSLNIRRYIDFVRTC